MLQLYGQNLSYCDTCILLILFRSFQTSDFLSHESAKMTYNVNLHCLLPMQIFSMWCVSPMQTVGLALRTSELGTILAISGHLIHKNCISCLDSYLGGRSDILENNFTRTSNLPDRLLFVACLFLLTFF
jgi:hypothetical protein